MPIHLEHHVSRLIMKISAMATGQRVTIYESECIDCSYFEFENKLEYRDRIEQRNAKNHIVRMPYLGFDQDQIDE